MTTDDLARAALAYARAALDALQLEDSAVAVRGLPIADVTVLELGGRQRDVDVDQRQRLVVATGRPTDGIGAGRRRTFSWTGRPPRSTT